MYSIFSTDQLEKFAMINPHLTKRKIVILMCSDEQLPLPQFTLNGTQFPRDIGRMILMTALNTFKSEFAIEHELHVIMFRSVCKTWRALVPRELIDTYDRNDAAIRDILREPDLSYLRPMIPRLISLGYSISSQHEWSACEETAEQDDLNLFKLFLHREKKMEMGRIWRSAITHNSRSIITYLSPAICFNPGLKATSFRTALYYSSDVETLQTVASLFPIGPKIPSLKKGLLADDEWSKEKWEDVIDWIVEHFEMSIVIKWIKGLIDNEYFSIVFAMLYHLGEVDPLICRYLRRNGNAYDFRMRKAFHKRLMPVCECTKKDLEPKKRKTAVKRQRSTGGLGFRVSSVVKRVRDDDSSSSSSSE